jgi:ribosomal-protein-alanine N-acetyltransferase
MVSISLRPLRTADWAAVHGWASLEESSRYQPWGPNSEQESQDFVGAAVRAWHQHPQDRYVWAVQDGDTVVGLGELHVRNRRWRQGEIAYAVHPHRWGEGIATRAGREVLGFAFHDLALHRIEGRCDPRNVASAAVLEKLGMTREGQLRQAVELADGWRDSLVYSILAHEWRASR